MGGLRLTRAPVGTERHATLAGVGVPGPYILVGHSLGALISRLYDLIYPQQVAGVIFVDPCLAVYSNAQATINVAQSLIETARVPSATSPSPVGAAPRPSVSASPGDELEWQKPFSRSASVEHLEEPSVSATLDSQKAEHLAKASSLPVCVLQSRTSI